MTSTDLWNRLIAPQLAAGKGLSLPPESWAQELRLEYALMSDAQRQSFAEMEWSIWRGPQVSQPMPPGWDALQARLDRWGLDEAENDATLQGFTEADAVGLAWGAGRYAVGRGRVPLWRGRLTARGADGRSRAGTRGSAEVQWGGEAPEGSTGSESRLCLQVGIPEDPALDLIDINHAV